MTVLYQTAKLFLPSMLSWTLVSACELISEMFIFGVFVDITYLLFL